MFTEERALWLYRHYRWLERALPTFTEGSPREARLILPTQDFYPQRNTRDHLFAQALFDQTRLYMGMENWPCVLTPQSEEDREVQERLSRAGGMFGLASTGGPAGTFRAGDEVEITYSPQSLKEPVNLVATFAHELCHYLLACVEEAPPAGWAELEPITDLCAVHEGFGVFLCNSAFTFGQWQDSQYQGWGSRIQGYLTTAELGFSLGIYCIRNRIDPELAMAHLKQNPGEVFWDSLGFIEDLEQTPPGED